MTYVLLQVDFPFTGPFGEEMTRQLEDLAKDIATEPGLVWKIWTENRDRQEAGGIYLFEDADNAMRYLDKHAKRLKAWGVPEVNGKLFEVNEPLSRLDRAPV